jgi:DNA polymerase III subunit alpha
MAFLLMIVAFLALLWLVAKWTRKKPIDEAAIPINKGKTIGENYAQKRKQEFYNEIEAAFDEKIPHYFVFDIETNGLPDYYDAPPEETANWPHPLSIGFVVLNENLQLIRKKYFVLKQDCEIDEEALSINGLSKELIDQHGQDPNKVYDEISLELKSCKKIIAHNIEFDLTILHADFIRKGKKTTIFKKAKFCTMKKTTEFVGIPRLYGSGYKWPKLSELIAACFFIGERVDGFKFEEAHDALWDAEATAKCFIYLLKNEYVKG